ncbi:unnamed protein product, partial [Prorocentrum cordatum]
MRRADGRGPSRRAKEAEPAGPLQRVLVATRAVHGVVASWWDKFGWIQPAQALDHPLAARHHGKIFFSAQDASGVSGVGEHVTCFVYEDANGLGAMNVRPAGPEQQLALLPAAAPGQGPVPVLPPPRAPLGAAQSPACRGRSRLRGASRRRARRARAAPEAYGTRRGGYAPGRQRQTLPAEHGDVLARVQQVLAGSVPKAVEDVAHMEHDWNPQEMGKRISKCIYKAAQSPELLGMPWREAAVQCVDHTVQGLSATCRDKEWFFDLDLLPTLVAVLSEIVKDSAPRAALDELEAVVTARYEDLLDSVLLEKAMWDATCATFPGDHACGRIFRYLHASYPEALRGAKDEAMSKKLSPLKRVELFMSRWMEGSMHKAWQAIHGSEQLLTLDSLLRLFGSLLAPFGEDHPFSCVPTELTERIGRPPRDWPHVARVARQLLASWRQPVPEGAPAPTDPPPPKRHRAAAAAAEAAAAAAAAATAPPAAEGEGAGASHDAATAGSAAGGAE